MSIILSWLVSAISVIITAKIVPGITVSNFVAALLAALVIGLVNGTLGFLLQILAFPITFLTLGLFALVINALMLLLSAAIVPGFSVKGFVPALFGSILITIISVLLKFLLPGV